MVVKLNWTIVINNDKIIFDFRQSNFLEVILNFENDAYWNPTQFTNFRVVIISKYSIIQVINV